MSPSARRLRHRSAPADTSRLAFHRCRPRLDLAAGLQFRADSVDAPNPGWNGSSNTDSIFLSKVPQETEMPSAAQAETPAQAAPDERPSPDFHISTTVSLQERQAHTLKHGDTFAVFDHRGDIGADPRSAEGMYHNDTRVLSRLELLLEGSPPLLLSSMNQDDNAVFTADLSNPDLVAGGKIVLRRELIQLHRLKFIWNAACYERVLVRNFSEEPQRLRLSLRFAADFVDLFEVRGT